MCDELGSCMLVDLARPGLNTGSGFWEVLGHGFAVFENPFEPVTRGFLQPGKPVARTKPVPAPKTRARAVLLAHLLDSLVQ